MIKEAIAKMVERFHLSREEAGAVMGEIMKGEATPAQIGAFLLALRMKGETPEEVAGSAEAMRAHAIPVRCRHPKLVDTAGTGGDRYHTFNISTVAAFVIAACGLPVAKHGNRAVSSLCGSADLMEALGVNLNLSPEQVGHCIDEVGIGFLFAPAFHPAMKYAAPVRRELGLRTIFNLLGPLCNPAGACYQLLGVYNPNLTELVAEALKSLGTEHAMVVHNLEGLDELSTTGVNKVTQVKDGSVTTYYLDPRELALEPASLKELAGGTPQENAEIARRILSGERGPRRDVVLLNTAAALVVGGLASDFKEGLARAAEAIDSGQARAKLKDLVEISCDFASRRPSC